MATIRRKKSEPFAIVQKDPGPWPQVLINWLATLAVIIVFGLIMLFSASYTTGYLRMGDSFYYIKSQMFCLGLGLGASSLVENVRYTNTRQLYEYGEFCDHLQEKSPAEFLKDGEHAVPEDLWIGSCVQEQAQILTRKEQMEEFMFLGLRMNEGVTRAAFEQSFGVPIEAVYLETLRKLKEQGLLQMVAGRIALTDKGMDLANYVMAKFLL